MFVGRPGAAIPFRRHHGLSPAASAGTAGTGLAIGRSIPLSHGGFGWPIGPAGCRWGCLQSRPAFRTEAADQIADEQDLTGEARCAASIGLLQALSSSCAERSAFTREAAGGR